MKNRLNITIDDNLIEQAKRYAADQNKSLSQLVEDYFRRLISKPKPRQQTFLKYMDTLPKPKEHVPEGDLKELYYRSRSKKYGF